MGLLRAVVEIRPVDCYDLLSRHLRRRTGLMTKGAGDSKPRLQNASVVGRIGGRPHRWSAASVVGGDHDHDHDHGRDHDLDHDFDHDLDRNPPDPGDHPGDHPIDDPSYNPMTMPTTIMTTILTTIIKS